MVHRRVKAELTFAPMMARVTHVARNFAHFREGRPSQSLIERERDNHVHCGHARHRRLLSVQKLAFDSFYVTETDRQADDGLPEYC